MGILTEEMKRLVREQSLGFVATVCPDGSPNLSPKGTTAVWDDDHLVFADLASPATIENLRSNPAVEVNVVDPFLRKGFRFKGTATVVADGPLFDEVVASYARVDEPIARDLAGRVRNVVLIEVALALPIISPSYETGRTEAEIGGWWRRYYANLEPGTE